MGKIAKNLNDDIEVGQLMLKKLTPQSTISATSTVSIAERNFSPNNQAVITNAVFAMIMEQPINFHRTGIESLKNSGYLQYLDHTDLE